MRRFVLFLCLMLAVPATAQQSDEQPGFFAKLFGTDEAESDAQQGSLLERLIEDNLSDAGRTVTVEGFEGALSGRATLDSLTISDAEGVWLTLEDATLDWNRSALFRGSLEVAELTAARILLPRLAAPGQTAQAPTPEATGFALPDLPVSVEIGRIAAEDVQIGQPVFGTEVRVSLDGSMSLSGGEGAAKLAIERRDAVGALTLDASYANATEALSLDLSLQEGEGGIFATLVGLPGTPSVDFSIAGSAPLSDYAADIRLATDGAERLAGQITLSETEDATRRIIADIAGDIAPVFAPQYRTFFGDQISLTAETLIAPDGQITVPAFGLTAEALSLTGSLELGEDRLPRRVVFTGNLASKNGAPVLLPISGPETRIDHAELIMRFDADTSEDWNADISLSGLNRDGLSAETLTLQGTGRIVPGDAPQVTAALTFDARQFDAGISGLAEAIGSDLTGKTDIAWDGGPVTIDGLELAGKALAATGRAEITLAETGPEVMGTLNLALDEIANFSTLAKRALSGTADLDTTFRVVPLAGAFDVRAKGQTEDLSISDPRADAILAGRTQLDLHATRDEDGLRVRLDRLGSDAAEVTASADLKTGGSTISLEGELKDTSILLPALSGASRITFSGLEDAERDWTVQTTLSGPEFSAEVDGTLSDLYSLPAFDGSVVANVANLSAFSDLAGRPLNGQLAINAVGSVNADLSSVSIKGDANGAGVSIGQAEVDRLLSGALSATIDAVKDGNRVEIAEFDLSTALLKARISGELADNDAELVVDARLADVAPFASGFSGPLSVTGTVGRQDAALTLDLDATGPGGAQAKLAGTLAEDMSTANLTARGTAPLGLANRFIQPRSLSGTAGFDLSLNGALQPQNLSGSITTSGARLAAPALGLALGDISGNIMLGGGTAEVSLQTVVDGGGRIAINGPVGMAAPNAAQLQINLASVALSDPKLYETTVDGQVRIDGPLTGGAAITGALALGQTDIRIPDSGFGGAGEVPEITHLNEPPPVRGTRRRAGLLASKSSGSGASGPSYPLDISVSAPNRIFVRGRGLDSEFGGNLRLTGTTANILPLGAFELIRGRLDILGRRLALEEARITMQGSFVPFIRLRASTDAEEYRVNVDVTGPVDNPEITFSSAPDLPQEEVLSRLIFGRGLETLSPLQAARLALAVRTLAGQGGEGVVGRIRGQTGLADLDVTTTEDGNAAVRAGAYLGENIYTDVTVDSTGETELNLNLDITPSLTARGGVTSTGDSSVGIFFERDY